MPLPASLIGIATEPVIHPVDSRWLMAYAASIGSHDACYLDTRRDGGVVGHPLFPVCLEWPAVLALRDRLLSAGLTSEEAARGVHYTHDLTVHRLARPGDRLSTTARLASVSAKRSGALAVIELVTVDESGQPVATTMMGTVYRDTPVAGAADLGAVVPRRHTVPAQPSTSDARDPSGRFAYRLPIHHNAAHVYTECARIWNPIHTDPRTAERAGLPGIILHGTATLAMAISGVVSQEASGQPQRIRHIGARFVGMVPIPTEIEIRILDRRRRHGTADGLQVDGDLVTFDVRGGTGQVVLSHGTAVVAGP